MKKIKWLLLFWILTLLWIGSSFGANPFWYNTIIRESNQIALQGLESYNYYNTLYTYDVWNNWQFYSNLGFCLYDSYSSFTFDCNWLLNSWNYLNSSLVNFVSFWNWNIIHNVSTQKLINHQSSFDFDLSWNIRYSINDCMSWSNVCITNANLYFSNSWEFWELVSSEPASYIHLIWSNYNKNPWILWENKMNHYYFITSKRISSDYWNFYDIPSDYIRKKFYNWLNHTISSISYNSWGFLLFTSTNPLQWSYNESNNIYRLISTSYSWYLVLWVNTYLNWISQNWTIVLSISWWNIFYNYYNSDSPYLNVLSNLIPQDKWYFWNSSLFNSFINDSWTYFEVSWIPNNWNLLIRSYLNWLDAWWFYTDYNFELVSDSNIPVIIPPIWDWWGWSQSNFSWSVSLDNCIETTVYTYSTWVNWENLHFSHTECLSPEIIESGSYISSNWTIYYVDSSYNVWNISNSDWTIYDTWFLDEDWMLSIDYYSWLFNWNWFKFWVCPYPASDYLNFATKIKLWNFYPFMPLNCFISAFQQWVKVHYFDDSWLFPDNHSQLLAWDSHYHKTLFRFFDVLLSIWILLLLSALLRIIKK